MCGRYSLALRPGQVRQMLQADNMPAYEAPPDYDGDGGGDDGDAASNDAAPRQSYNFAPGYHGIVYRADVPDWGAGPRTKGRGRRGAGDNRDGDTDEKEEGGDGRGDVGETGVENPTPNEDRGPVQYKLQSMKWGLIPFWTKRNPDYGSMMKTINCRDDSLAQGAGGMWSSMKARKRCVVVAQGFYEWLKKGPGGREKVPHFVKRKDGRLMCFAGLWDVVQYENDDRKYYTYTIITTDSNKQLSFLHDRMPVILDNGSEGLRTWLDPGRHEWSKELQSLLKPFEGELEVYPVSKDVGKVGNNSPSFIIPVDSKENKSNIANFFATQKRKAEEESAKERKQPEVEVEAEEGFVAEDDSSAETGIDTKAEVEVKVDEDGDAIKKEDEEGSSDALGTAKREAEAGDEIQGHVTTKKKIPTTTATTTTSPSSSPPQKKRPKISATSNGTATPTKAGVVGGKAKEKEKGEGGATGNQKITKFFANSS